ncbi:MAG: DnaJ domain-containing protein [Deltaproteobacteria bacterium]|nr:DnaJ domain-containing protein [Deltaproteobacteria bacterium]MDQ3298900.1 DnaJ domain-containing protein [Myxococcota bacterium]
MATGALSIKLRCASWQQLATIYKRDLSRGSMFLKAASPPALGTAVRIDLTLPSGSVIALTGVVDQHVNDSQRGSGVELKLAPIPAGSVWMIENALGSEANRKAAAPKTTPATGVPQVVVSTASGASTVSGPISSLRDGEVHQVSAAESDLVRALVAEAESLKKLNPFLVLGIGYEANDADVRSAFGDLTKRYHPDRFARYESAELRQVAAEIFILIRDAYRRLGDEASRAQVLASLGRHAGAPRAVPGPQARIATPPTGMPRMAIRHGSAQVPPLAKPAQTPPLPMPVVIPARPAPPPPQASASPQTDAVTRKPEPLPPTSAGNDLTTKRPQPLPVSEARPTGTTPPPATERLSVSTATPLPQETAEHAALDALLDAGRYDEALSAYRAQSKKHPNDRTLRAGIELCEGLAALALRDRLEAAQRFEAALEIDPSNERAARELADMRRQATNERKGLLSRLMGKKE